MSSKLAALCLSWLQKASTSLCESGGMPFQHINSPFKFPLKVAQAKSLPHKEFFWFRFVPDFLTLTPNQGACQAPVHSWAAGGADCALSLGRAVCAAGEVVDAHVRLKCTV